MILYMLYHNTDSGMAFLHCELAGASLTGSLAQTLSDNAGIGMVYLRCELADVSLTRTCLQTLSDNADIGRASLLYARLRDTSNLQTTQTFYCNTGNCLDCESLNVSVAFD